MLICLFVVGVVLNISARGFCEVKYPSAVGYVNDFANVLPPETKRFMEAELKDYADRTTNQIAVVTVKSLEGLPVEEYTINLATKWGVGQKGKDNGVMLLMALKERKVRIEVGYGLEGDLTDLKSGRIIKDTIVPYFKKGEMAQGIQSGVDEIINVIGDLTPDQRLAKQEEQKKLDEEQAMIITSMFMVLVILASLFLMIIFVREHINDVKQARKQIKNLRQTVSGLISELEGKNSSLAHADSGIKKEDFATLKARFKNLRFDEKRSGKQDISFAFDMQTISLGLESLKRNALRNIAKADKAREEGPKFVAELPDRLREIDERLNDENTSERVKKNLAKAREKLLEARKVHEASGNPDWLTVVVLFAAASGLLDQADRSNSSSLSSSSRNDSISSGHSSSGFGGGGFGGGGASGDW